MLPVARRISSGRGRQCGFQASTAASGSDCQYPGAGQVNNACGSPRVANTAALVDAPEAGAYRSWHEREASQAAALDKQRVHGDGPTPRSQGEEQVGSRSCTPCAHQGYERQAEGWPGQRQPARAAGGRRMRARSTERGAGALQGAAAPAGGNPSTSARPHRLGARFASQHPGRQGLTPHGRPASHISRVAQRSHTLLFHERGVDSSNAGLLGASRAKTRGPIRSARELSLTEVVASDTRRPPTLVGTQRDRRSNGFCGSACLPCSCASPLDRALLPPA